MTPPIRKAGLLVIERERVLLCRKRGAMRLLILPGGKIEAGESAEESVRREVREELGDVEALGLWHVGSYSDAAGVAAGEPPRQVEVELFGGALRGVPAARSEIAELVWFGEGDDRETVSPVLRNRIFPDLVRRRILPWRRIGESGKSWE
jgi:8-oxo-dGTP pyrophosphatase MutT (NUDIX family)